MVFDNDSPEARRFWGWVKRGDESECWLWQAKVMNGGYGYCWIDGSHQLAHRYSYQLANGEIPKGTVICHSCDNRLCVNPGHLWVGSQRDNMRDAVNKGRVAVARLKDEDFAEVIRLKAMGMGQRAIAKIFGCSQVNICHVLKRYGQAA